MASGEYDGDEYTLEDTLHVENFSLEEALERNPVVLVFFPGVFSPVCYDELREFQDVLNEFADLGVEVYGISVDPPFSQNKFIHECEIEFPLLSDLDRKIIEEFDVVSNDLSALEPFGYEYDGTLGIAKRSVFALDRDGTVTYKWISDSPLGMPDLDEVKRAVTDVA